jgi:predicted lysophospholipase L1 biosynthesis ABC-type transport system permease subunit
MTNHDPSPTAAPPSRVAAVTGGNGAPAASAQAGVQRQITLPLSKAVEIAYKSIRLRLSRSLVVTSGIVLALAFLMSILCSDAIVDGMRTWAHSTRGDSPHMATLRERRDALDAKLKPLQVEIANLATKAPAPKAEETKFDPEEQWDMTFAELQQDLGGLPASAADLEKGLTTKRDVVLPKVEEWIALTRESRAVKDELTAPQRLEALMRENGVPTTPAEIEGNRIQTRWLLGLALLVAFVGILNAMLMSVTERFREIGTMKCLGALDSFIIKLFLIESLFQGVVGTIIGVSLGLLLSLAGSATTYGRFAWDNIPWGSIMASVGLCLVVGIGLTVAGAVYPAWQAARMQPIEAMRVDT